MPTEETSEQDRPMTRAEIDRRIAELRTHHLPPRTREEHLDCPLDERIRIDTSPGRHKLVLAVNGADVSWSTIVHFEQQIGNATVRMGGIAGVGTHDQHRFKGYSRCVLENCLIWMRQHGYHTSMLYGIPSYYPKFGYAKAFPRMQFSVAVRDTERIPPGPFTWIDFNPDKHARTLLRIYHDNNRGRTGVTRRDPETWRDFRKGMAWNSRAAVQLACSPAGVPAGYLVVDDKPLTANVIEVGYATPKVLPALLREAGRWAWRQRLETVTFHLPEDDPFIVYCRGYGLQQHAAYPGDGGGMVRMIDVHGALRAVASELARRVSGSGAVTLQTNLGDVCLRWDSGALRVQQADPRAATAELPQWALAQMLYGYQHVSAMQAAGTLRGDAKALSALKRMFPPCPHYQYLADHF